MEKIYSVPNKGYIIKETNVEGVIGNYYSLYDCNDNLIDSSIKLSYLIQKLDRTKI